MNKRVFFLIGFFTLLIIGVGYFARKDLLVFWNKSWSFVHGVISLNTSSQHEEFVKVVFLDIGQGDATFIEFSNGEQMLVDCSEDARILESLGRVMDFRDRVIDYVLVSHPHVDHFGGCTDVLKRYTIKNVIWNGYGHESGQAFSVFLDTVKKENAQIFTIESEQKLTISSTTLHFLYPDEKLMNHDLMKTGKQNLNNTSVVFSLQFGSQKVLFTGDAEQELEMYLVKKYGDVLNSDILKAGHHGSHTSSQSEFLELITPDITTISSGKDNEYGHPSARVLKRLERVGSEVWRTDQKHDILIKIFADHHYVQNS